MIIRIYSSCLRYVFREMIETAAEKQKRRCLNCGKPLAPSQRKFCSLDCCTAFGCRPRQKVCPTCGRVFISREAKRECNRCIYERRSSGFNRTYKPKTVYRPPQIPKKPDTWAAYEEARKKAEAEGRRLSYGEWASKKEGKS